MKRAILHFDFAAIIARRNTHVTTDKTYKPIKIWA